MDEADTQENKEPNLDRTLLVEFYKFALDQVRQWENAYLRIFLGAASSLVFIMAIASFLWRDASAAALPGVKPLIAGAGTLIAFAVVSVAVGYDKRVNLYLDVAKQVENALKGKSIFKWETISIVGGMERAIKPHLSLPGVTSQGKGFPLLKVLLMQIKGYIVGFRDMTPEQKLGSITILVIFLSVWWSVWFLVLK